LLLTSLFLPGLFMDNIQHISDTALWIAAYRAQESQRPDAVFNDHFADRLAGPRGHKMIEETPHRQSMAFAMVVRTSAIDRLVNEALKLNVDAVINLAAGLDTRPYRMKLPAALNWIEVDFPSIINYKNELLKDEKPSCKLQRTAADLSDEKVREKLFSELRANVKNALVITEGLIGYLKNEEAASLSKAIYDTPGFNYWIQDYSQGKMRRHKQSKDLSKKMQRTPIQFNEANPLGFFGRQGWKIKKNIFILDEADRIGRKLPAIFPWSYIMKIFPKMIRKLANETYGYVMFSRA
jgi:methyltransferase (TIGR00027 family)